MYKKQSTFQYISCGLMYFLIALSLISLIFQGFIGYNVYSNSQILSENGINAEKRLNILDLIPVAGDVIKGDNVPLKGEAEGRTNFLLLGEDPEAGLNDTIMILSYFHKSNKISTINIPRDFYVTTPDIAGEKINGVVNIIETYTKQDGVQYLIDFIEDEFLINIDYFANINISGLSDIVDLIGGIEIEVACTFTDYNYPAKDYNGYLSPAPKFTKGIEKMDGQRAVIYSRSRKSLDCNEGTDFARNRRQSEVIAAILTKIKQTNLVDNTLKISEYLDLISDNLTTNMSIQEIYSLAQKVKDINTETDYISYNLSTSTEYICSTTSTSGQYIITYGQAGNCGRYIAGSKVSNIYRTNLRNLILNLDKYQEKEDLTEVQ